MEPQTLFKCEHSHKIFKDLCEVSPKESHCMWKYLCAINEIPRGSGKTEKVRAWLQEIGAKLGAEVAVDKAGNVSLRVPASKGKESIPSVIFQGHYDMVHTKSSTSTHNFDTDPIKMMIDPTDPSKLTADNTTLGADNGHGVACCLAIIENKDAFEHGPIECLLTKDEEIGLVGANALNPEEKIITDKAKYLVNIDSEEWGMICVSSAGTAQRQMKVKIEREPLTPDFAVIDGYLCDFMGGHSGVQIHEGNANATKWAVALMTHAGADARLIALDGGHAHNAIPSSVRFQIAVPTASVEEVMKKMEKEHAHLLETYKAAEIKIPKLELKKGEAKNSLTKVYTQNVLSILNAIPHGVFRYSLSVPGLVETSQNLCIAKLHDTEFEAQVFARSADNEMMKKAVDSFACLCKIHDAECSVMGDDTGGWPADVNSKLLKITKDTIKDLYKMDCEVGAIHAGLENSVIMNKFAALNLESISMGPTIQKPHTPDETVDIDSGSKVYVVAVEIAKRLAN
eukprot:GCRY01000515.1.p1 GENE.GCRY01000515.1~~GCRY01000515.1.p1  ORF type:complete len:565 (+),score=178.49 GCRY01000515.1:160-1695(+)